MDRIVLLVFVFAFTAAAAIEDLRTKKVPNALVVPAALAGLAYHVVCGAIASGFAGAGSGLLFSLGGFGTGFGTLFVLWLIGGGGGGDVKFMGALGAWLGAWLTLQVLFVSAVFTVFGAFGVLAWRYFQFGPSGMKKYARKTTSARGNATAKSKQERAVQRRLMPFAVPAAAATWSVLIVTEFFLNR